MSLLQCTCAVEAEVDADSVASPCDPKAKLAVIPVHLIPFEYSRLYPCQPSYRSTSTIGGSTPMAIPTQVPIRART